MDYLSWLFLSSDPSLNPHLLTPVFTAITGDWWDIHPPPYPGFPTLPGYPIVPDARAALFRERFTDHDKVRAEAGKYYALYHHNPSWNDLSCWLYKAGETKAVGIAKTRVHSVTGK